MRKTFYRQIYRQKYLLELRRNMQVEFENVRTPNELEVPQAAGNY